jgi:hypothetical protein
MNLQPADGSHHAKEIAQDTGRSSIPSRIPRRHASGTERIVRLEQLPAPNSRRPQLGRNVRRPLLLEGVRGGVRPSGGSVSPDAARRALGPRPGLWHRKSRDPSRPAEILPARCRLIGRHASTTSRQDDTDRRSRIAVRGWRSPHGAAALTEAPSERMRVVPNGARRLIRFSSDKLEVQRHLCHIHAHQILLVGQQIVAEAEETHGVQYFFPSSSSCFWTTRASMSYESSPSITLRTHWTQVHGTWT